MGWRPPTLTNTPLFSQSSWGGGDLDLGQGAEGVLAGVNVLAAPETCEHLGAAVAHASRLHVEQIAIVGLQRVADLETLLGERGVELRPSRKGIGHRGDDVAARGSAESHGLRRRGAHARSRAQNNRRDGPCGSRAEAGENQRTS